MRFPPSTATMHPLGQSNLLQALTSRDHDDLVFLALKRSLSIGMIVDTVNTCRAQWKELENKQIRLMGKTNLDSIMGMMLLDGFALGMILDDGP